MSGGAEKNRDTIIRISQFIIRKESEALAKDCQKGLIETVFFNVGNKGLELSEIQEEIHKQMGLKNFPLTIIQSTIIESPEVKEEIYEKDDKYYLESDTYKKIENVVAERKASIQQFELTLNAKVLEESNRNKIESDFSNEALRMTYKFLAVWFSSQSNFIARSIRAEKRILMPSYPIELLNSILSETRDELERSIIKKSIIDTFQTLESSSGKVLYEILENYLHLELLNIDPECRYLQNIAFSKKTLVLDTNILMALFLPSDVMHVGVNDVISIARDLGVNLVFTKRTEEEWLWGLERASEGFQAVRSERPSLLPSLENSFIQSFIRMQAANSSLNWQSFYLQMRQIKTFAREKGISFWYKKEMQLEHLPNKEYYEPLWGRVYACAQRKGFTKTYEVSQHDAYHLLLIRKLRDENPPDILGPSCWFFTMDSTLYCADEGLNQFMSKPFDPPSSFMADMWITVIAPFLGPEIEENRLADAFAHLMTTQFATMHSGISANAVIEVLGPWLPYGTLSDKDMEAILSDAMVMKYYGELKEARIKDPKRIEELSAKLHKQVEGKVFEAFDAKVLEANQKKQEAERLAQQKEEQLLAETQRRKMILKICAILGTAFAVFGLLFLAVSNLVTGIALTCAAIAFLVLALGFRHIKLKTGPFEMEANR